MIERKFERKVAVASIESLHKAKGRPVMAVVHPCRRAAREGESNERTVGEASVDLRSVVPVTAGSASGTPWRP